MLGKPSVQCIHIEFTPLSTINLILSVEPFDSAHPFNMEEQDHSQAEHDDKGMLNRNRNLDAPLGVLSDDEILRKAFGMKEDAPMDSYFVSHMIHALDLKEQAVLKKVEEIIDEQFLRDRQLGIGDGKPYEELKQKLRGKGE